MYVERKVVDILYLTACDIKISEMPGFVAVFLKISESSNHNCFAYTGNLR